MKLIQIISTICLLLFDESNAIRLHKMFQLLDGFKSEHNIQGFLHVGDEYAIFLRTPKPHDKYLVYELYETKNLPEADNYSPRMLAISKVPVEYLKEQLTIFRDELYHTKYFDKNVVPGTQTKTLREWQIERALKFPNNAGHFHDKLPMLRSIF